jgi:predicted regulator of Ras-like GTPase activity (Roadblock/LC7/MglB family)
MKTTIGVFTTHATAELGLQELRNSGIEEGDLSYLYQNTNGDLKDGQSGGKVATAATTGVATGVVIGGIAGLVIANGILPGFGSLIVGGSLAEALGAIGATALAGAGAIAGGFVGGLTQMGIKMDDVHLYEEHVRKGEVLVIARSENTQIQEILKKSGAHNIREYMLS